MSVMARSSPKKSWQSRREHVSVQADLAIRREIVMERLLRLREEIGHPERPGKPLPAEEAAARVGVKHRTWQRWESGESVPYARSLAKVADTFDIELAEFDDGTGRKNGPTPTPFAGQDALADRFDALEKRVTDQLAEHAKAVEGLIAKQNQLLDRQSAVLAKIEARLGEDRSVRDELSEAIQRRTPEIVQGLPGDGQGRSLEPQRSKPGATKRAAKQRTP